MAATAAQVIHEQLGYPNVVIPLLEQDHLVYRSHTGAYRDVFKGEHRLHVSKGRLQAPGGEMRKKAKRRAHRLEELSQMAFAEMRALLRELRPVSNESGTGEAALGSRDEVFARATRTCMC